MVNGNVSADTRRRAWGVGALTMTKRGIGLGLLLILAGFGISCASAPERDRSLHEGLDGKGESQFAITLEGFQFSKNLDKDKANFRFIVGLRFFDKKGNFNTVHTILPGLDTYWECAPGKKQEPNYVGPPSKKDYGRFDMKAVGKWDSLIFLVKGVELHSIQFRVFDVNRPDVWDKIVGLIKGLFAMGVGVATANIPSAFAPPVQGLTDDLRLAVMNKITSEDKLLFRKALSFDENRASSEEYKISSSEGKGDYEIKFAVTRKEMSN